MRRMIDNASAAKEARAIRETFVDRPAEYETVLPWNWPRSMQEVGSCEAVCYTSDKWQKKRGDMIDYKHRAEGPQRLLVVPGFLREYARPSAKLPVVGPLVDLTRPMPSAFAELAPILGVQTRLYVGTDDDYHLPSGDDGLFHINVPHAFLGGAKHPKTGQKFLLVYTKTEGALMLITGDILNIEKDGITG